MKFIDPAHDAWHTIGGEDGPIPTPSPKAGALLTLEQWHAVRDHWPADLKVGVIAPNTLDVETLAKDLPRIAVIALQFPKWTDGRAYSQARVLRTRLRFDGEVRATGDVLVDMLPLLHRTGVDAVVLRHDQKLDSAQRALRFFAGHYQGDVHEGRPAFGRDTAADLARDAAARRERAEADAGQGI